MFYLVRHGDTDYSRRNTGIYQGFGTNLAPLTALGEAQIRAAAADPRLQGAALILSSPYTRAVQSAAILAAALNAEVAVETELHEWLADREGRWLSDEEAERAYRAFEENDGVRPAGQRWEDAADMRRRAEPVLAKYADRGKVIVVCHGMLIGALTGGEHPAHGEIVPYELP